MKLVDILARKITEWPQGQPCLWISDAHSATIYGKSGSFEVSFNGDWRCPEDYLDAIVYKAEWQAAVDALKAEKAAEWNGEGLPPVGSMVEIHKNGCGIRESAEEFLGIPVRVAAVFKIAESDVDMIVVDGGIGRGSEVFRANMAKPARASEQIAAEARQKAINQICIDAGSPEMTPGQLRVASKLYDAGYRKFEIVDN